jgi:hypothetical protein
MPSPSPCVADSSILEQLFLSVATILHRNDHVDPSTNAIGGGGVESSRLMARNYPNERSKSTRNRASRNTSAP